MTTNTKQCARCSHSGDWHRLDDSLNIGPTDPRAQFRCLGFDPASGGSPERKCDCPDFALDPGMFMESGRFRRPGGCED